MSLLALYAGPCIIPSEPRRYPSRREVGAVELRKVPNCSTGLQLITASELGERDADTAIALYYIRYNGIERMVMYSPRLRPKAAVNMPQHIGRCPCVSSFRTISFISFMNWSSF